ncbi:MAG: DUF488 domain-containing protein [Solirubrobacterales bacterium]
MQEDDREPGQRERAAANAEHAEAPDRSPQPIYTIGHSTHPVATFIAMLDAHGIETLVDVRTAPGSRRNPQFGKQALRQELAAAGIDYCHAQRLGGLRRPDADSVNGGWRNESFRGYADYMQTGEFTSALDELAELAGRGRAAIMCAEAVPWRCHRSLIGDALLARGIPVIDILPGARSRPHALTPFARVAGATVTYPPDAG